MSNANDRIKIIKQELKCKNYKELADLMGIKEGRIKTLASSKSTSSSFSEEELKILVKKFDFNMYWLVLGEGEMYRDAKKDNINIEINGTKNNSTVNGNIHINTSEFNHGADIKEILDLL